MELIDKAVLVAKIDRLYNRTERRVALEKEGLKAEDTRKYEDGLADAYDIILSFIDSIEVKEVDLDNEITDYINKHYHIRFDETLERGNDPLTTIDFEEIAKHFFELGIKVAQKDK